MSIRPLATALAAHAASLLATRRPAWAEAMRAEVESLEDDAAALRWAAGCVVASYAERINPMRAASLWPVLGVVALSMFIFGGYALGGGNMTVIFEAAPIEALVILCGACAATTIITTTGGRGIFRSLGLALHGRRFRTEDYRGLGTALINVLNDKALALTARTYPILYNRDVGQLMADALALADEGRIGADQFGVILQSRIEAMLGDQTRAVRVLKALGQTLLWLGLIALSLGVGKIFGSLTEPPEILAAMFAHALVGPDVGVFLAAGIVHPLARRLEAAIADDAHVYQIIRMAFVCRAAGASPEVAVRTAFGSLPSDFGMDQSELVAA